MDKLCQRCQIRKTTTPVALHCAQCQKAIYEENIAFRKQKRAFRNKTAMRFVKTRVRNNYG